MIDAIKSGIHVRILFGNATFFMRYHLNPAIFYHHS